MRTFTDAPRRWTRPARKIGRLVTILTMIMATIAFQNDGWSLLPAVLVSLIPGQLAGLAVRIGASLIFNSAYSHWERTQLYAIAAQSIVRLNDKRAIPGLLQLAFDAPLRNTGRHARVVLLSLLPQVTEQDAGLFSTVDIENVNGALAQSSGPRSDNRPPAHARSRRRRLLDPACPASRQAHQARRRALGGAADPGGTRSAGGPERTRAEPAARRYCHRPRTPARCCAPRCHSQKASPNSFSAPPTTNRPLRKSTNAPSAPDSGGTCRAGTPRLPELGAGGALHIHFLRT